MRRIGGLSPRQGRWHILWATLARPMLILSVMPRRGRGMRAPAIVGVVCVVRMLVVFRRRGIVMIICMSCIAVRMSIARADAERKLQRQQGCSDQSKQV